MYGQYTGFQGHRHGKADTEHAGNGGKHRGDKHENHASTNPLGHTAPQNQGRLPQGNNIGIAMNSNGFTDLYGLRRTKVMDFSEWDSGYFNETVDGDINIQYSIQFDSSGRPVKITDGSHETSVIW